MTEHLGGDLKEGTKEGLKGIWKLIEGHWQLYAIGAGALIVLYYISASQSSAAATTAAATGTATDPNADALAASEYQTQAALQGQALQAATALQEQQVAASASVTSQQIASDSQDFVTALNTGSQSVNYLGGQIAGQTDTALQTLGQGFGSFLTSTATEASAAVSAGATLGAANDAANGQQLSTLLSGAALLTGKAGGLGFLPQIAAGAGSSSSIGLPTINIPF